MMKRTPILAILGLVASCTSHNPHRVTDLESGRVYCTRDLRRGLSSGKIRLTDAKTGETLVIGSSKVEQIPEEEFAREVGAK